MKWRWAAVPLVAVLSALTTSHLAAQADHSSAGSKKVAGSQSELGQNSPNPFTVDTRIPFTVGDYPACSDPSRVYRVSLRIYNILAQRVAVTVLQDGSESVESGTPLDGVSLPCGQYTAYWDAKNSKTGREVPPGVYMYRLEVDGRPAAKKMTYSKQ